MKTTIFELLRMIKDGKAPYKILYDDRVYIFDNFEQDYLAEGDHYLFDEYIVVDILNDEVEILETTITYKSDKIEKIEPFKEEVNIFEFALEYPEVAKVLKSYEKKIAKLIEVVNKL